MINSEVNSNGLGNSGIVMPSNHKQSPLVKKIPLRDVQNDNRSSIRNHLESSPVLEGRPTTDAIKVSGTKRLTPEPPLSIPFDSYSSKNGVNEQLMHVQRKFESEPGRGRIQVSTGKSAACLQLSSKQSFQKQLELPRQQSSMRESNLYCPSMIRPNHMASIATFSYGRPSVPISLGKPGSALQVSESIGLKVSSEVCHSVDFKATNDQQRKERYLHLQEFLKQCDESDQCDYVHMLLNLPPAELSRHAVELEKKAIQLTVEEGKQMQRMKALNILRKSGSANSPLLTSQHLQYEK